MDLIQESSTYQAISVIVATEEYIILNMHLILTLDSYLSKSIFISIILVLSNYKEYCTYYPL